jgi:hypothetical protein
MLARPSRAIAAPTRSALPDSFARCTFPLAHAFILGLGAVPFAWTALSWSSDLITQGHIWDENEVWGMIECAYLGFPVLLIGVGKLAWDNRPRRNSN